MGDMTDDAVAEGEREAFLAALRVGKPTTAAGRALDKRLAYDTDPPRYEPGDYLREYRDAILAIEAEAVAAERERIVAAAEAAWLRTRSVGAVLAAIRGEP